MDQAPPELQEIMELAPVTSYVDLKDPWIKSANIRPALVRERGRCHEVQRSARLDDGVGTVVVWCETLNPTRRGRFPDLTGHFHCNMQ